MYKFNENKFKITIDFIWNRKHYQYSILTSKKLSWSVGWYPIKVISHLVRFEGIIDVVLLLFDIIWSHLVEYDALSSSAKYVLLQVVPCLWILLVQLAVTACSATDPQSAVQPIHTLEDCIDWLHPASLQTELGDTSCLVNILVV